MGRCCWIAVAIVVFALGAGSNTTVWAQEACTVPGPTFPFELGGEEWCATGAVGPGEEVRLGWTSSVEGLRRIHFDALPGQLGTIRMVDPDGRDLWRGTVAGDGALESSELLLVAGRYEFVLSAGPAGLVYRAALAEPTPLPPSIVGPRDGQFEGLVRGQAAEIAMPWTVPAGASGDLWTIGAQAPVGVSMTLTLRDNAGTAISWINTPDVGGVFRLPDLALPSGAYSILLNSTSDGTPLIIEAERDTRPPGFASEPNNEPDTARPLELGALASGRLLGGGAYTDSDFFALTVPEGEPRLHDITLSVPFAATVMVALVDQSGRVLAQSDGARLISLRNLVLGSGVHFIRVSGSLLADVTYFLRVEETGALRAGTEIEPNNQAVDATPVLAPGLLSGRLDGVDVDYVALGVTGDLQLWDIEAIGQELSRISLYDGAGRLVLGTTAPLAGGVLRLGRVLLPPGSNVVRLEGNEGAWLLRANPIGPPNADEEFEPNNDAPRALVLPIGRPVTGWLDRADDRDVYAFHLDAWHRVTVTASTPNRLPLRTNLSWGDFSNRVAAATGPSTAAEAGLEWDGILAPGDYFLELLPTAGPGRQPYSLLLEVPSFFDRPMDLEPNDEPWQATMVETNRLAGAIEGIGADWFELPPAVSGKPVAVYADQLSGPLEIRLAHGDPTSLTWEPSVYLYQTDETATFNPPGGVRLFIGLRGAAGPYELSLEVDQERSRLPVELALTVDTAPVAAFEHVAQRLSGALTVRNTSDKPLAVSTASWLSDERWQLAGLPPFLDLPPGQELTIALTLDVPADARDGPVVLDVALRRRGVDPVFTRASIEVRTGVSRLAEHTYSPYPAALLGGLNVAWAALGAISDTPAVAALLDDVIDLRGANLTIGQPVGVRVAGQGAPVPLAGVVLHPTRVASPAERLSRFAVEISMDGATFERILEATLSPAAREQAFAFDSPVAATIVRLVPLSVASGNPSTTVATLAEFQVIATPDFVLEPAGFDVGDPRLGGHVIRTINFGDQAWTGEGAIWPGENAVYLPVNRAGPSEWMIGFRNGRAAEVAAFVWHERPDTPPDQRMRQIAVAASIDGPLGPWQDIGIFELAGGDEAQLLSYAAPTWARVLRFTVLEPDEGRLTMPDRIEIREVPGLSILGVWGDLSPAGPFEATVAVAETIPPLPQVSLDPSAPTPLPLGSSARGEVRRGSVENWFEVALPEDTRTLRATFAAGTAPLVSLSLVATDGSEVPFMPDQEDPSTLVAVATPGEWRLRVTQPVASVAIAWDTSGSVGALQLAIERMIRRLAWELEPAREAINLLPFRGDPESFLIPEWTGDRGAVHGALHAYPFRDSSSNAESALLFSAAQLAQRPGNRAIVIVTDASFTALPSRNEQLWESFARSRPHVFSLYLPVNDDALRAGAQTGLMSDWASLGGHISRFASQGDSELAFRRLAAWQDRPLRHGELQRSTFARG